jgi:hypothetical protein
VQVSSAVIEPHRSHPAWCLVEADLRDVALEVDDLSNNPTVSTMDMISAPTMVQLGLHLDGVPTALDLEEGLAYLDRLNRRC